MYDFLIVGTGFFGATFARICADRGKKCLVIDNKDRVGGMTAEDVVHGLNVCRHGAHIFHTHDKTIWDFINQFGQFNNYVHTVKASAKGKIYSFPVNLLTLHQIWGITTPAEALEKLQQVRIPCPSPKNAEEWMLSLVGKDVYELFYHGYTKKQWLKEPSELPASIVQRLPIRLTYDDHYFATPYQGMPVEGYTQIIKNLLDGTDTELGTDFFSIKWQDVANNLVYTGPIDRFFDYCFGKLEYRTLRFETKIYTGDYQGTAVINHCDYDMPYIRSVEHKHFLHSTRKHQKTIENDPTVITYDIPATIEETQAPYYPIRDEKNLTIYNQYVELSKNHPSIIFGGRLGEYQYYDIDQTIASAISKANKIVK